MEPSELQSDLGPNKSGVDALLLGYDDAFVLHWPFTPVAQQRQPSVSADWLATSVSDQEHPTAANSAESLAAEVAKQPTKALDTTPPKRQRLILRQQDEELIAMATSGTPLPDAAESTAFMTGSPAGGNHEFR